MVSISFSLPVADDHDLHLASFTFTRLRRIAARRLIIRDRVSLAFFFRAITGEDSGTTGSQCGSSADVVWRAIYR